MGPGSPRGPLTRPLDLLEALRKPPRREPDPGPERLHLAQIQVNHVHQRGSGGGEGPAWRGQRGGAKEASRRASA